MRHPPRSGFTLVELIVVIVIIGILAAIGIPTFANTTAKANVAAAMSDLRNLATAQESYFYTHATYGPTLTAVDAVGSPGVTITVVEATPAGWSATAVPAGPVPATCALFYGSATPVPPATVAGQIACK